jgi:hypothetical protein
VIELTGKKVEEEIERRELACLPALQQIKGLHFGANVAALEEDKVLEIHLGGCSAIVTRSSFTKQNR